MNIPRIALIASFLLICSNANATILPGRWDKVAQLREGAEVVVSLTDGQRVEGEFLRLSATELVLTRDTNRLIIEKSNVREVQVPVVKSLERQYTGRVGLAIGAGVGLLIGAAAYKSDESGWGNATIPMAAFIGAGTGYAAGKIVESRFPDYQTIYSAP